MIRNAHWYSLNGMRRYPVDDAATGTDDDGVSLRDDIIVDLTLRWPGDPGEVAYLGGVTISPQLVTLVIMRAAGPDAASPLGPLAAFNMRRPVQRHVHYALDGLLDGVAGFVTFGDTTEVYSARFSTPAQSFFCARAARHYRPLPVVLLRKEGVAAGLSGLVTLRGEGDIETAVDEIDLGAGPRTALLLRCGLEDTGTGNPLFKYAGPCGRRPESGTCRHVPLEAINGVTPDCDGDLRIYFKGITAGAFSPCGAEQAGVTLDTAISIDDVCAPAGPLGGIQGTDYCDTGVALDSSSLSSAGSLGAPVEPDPEPDPGMSEACEPVPFVDSFNTGLHGSWVVRAGAVDVVAGIARLTGSYRRQAAIWEDCGGLPSLGKSVTTRLRLTNESQIVNGGLILNNHLVNPISDPRETYHLVLLNRDTNELQLLRFNGDRLRLVHASAPQRPFGLNIWYDLTASAVDAGGGLIAVSATLRCPSDPWWGVMEFTVPVPATLFGTEGYHGIGNDRSVTEYTYWGIG